jgi:hypothetical protein
VSSAETATQDHLFLMPSSDELRRLMRWSGFLSEKDSAKISREMMHLAISSSELILGHVNRTAKDSGGSAADVCVQPARLGWEHRAERERARAHLDASLIIQSGWV